VFSLINFIYLPIPDKPLMFGMWLSSVLFALARAADAEAGEVEVDVRGATDCREVKCLAGEEEVTVLGPAGHTVVECC